MNRIDYSIKSVEIKMYKYEAYQFTNPSGNAWLYSMRNEVGGEPEIVIDGYFIVGQWKINGLFISEQGVKYTIFEYKKKKLT